LLPGVVELAQLVFGLDVRIGYPEGISGRVNGRGTVYSPIDATALGLVAHAYRTEYSGDNCFVSVIEAPKTFTPPASEELLVVQEPNIAWKKVVDGLQDWWSKL
jgi:cell division protein FtsA